MHFSTSFSRPQICAHMWSLIKPSVRGDIHDCVHDICGISLVWLVLEQKQHFVEESFLPLLDFALNHLSSSCVVYFHNLLFYCPTAT